METRQMKLLEIGCANSVWLPYFAKEFGFQIFGLDYSEIGCEQEKYILSKAAVKGDVVCSDFFAPPETMLEEFDVVISFGVAEHFEDTATCIQAFSKFLKPKGIMITIIPNMVGLTGWFQKLINRPVFDIHVLLDSDALAESHKVSKLKVVDCDYFMSTHFGVCNLNGIPIGSIAWLIKKGLLFFLIGFSVIIWYLETKLGRFKPNRLASPYINCVALK
ncbi:MAG: class I SAM-dependent methyltransferase [Coleofasciculus sp. S288]|nr:class I SAM-dependent methyltransferase [Coleofasciculus sp. S288]